MFGNIDEIRDNSFGFIFSDEGRRVFFHKSNLKNCTIRELEEGDGVEFEMGIGNNGREQALQVRKRFQVSSQAMTTNPGIHPSAKENLSHFNEDEKQIIRFLATVFHVTNSGESIQLGGSEYRYCLIKPTEYFVHAFHMNREIVVVFSDYVHFQPRCLDVASAVYAQIASKLRLDRGCHIIISHDDSIEEKLSIWLKDNNFDQIIVPFTYSEMMSPSITPEIVQERFRKYLFDTDLFATAQPVRDDSFNDIFFFGRRDYLQDIVSKCKNGTHSGIFGLRRSGKTSMLYGVLSQLKQQEYPTVYIPCESELSNLDWQAALCKVVLDVYRALGIDDRNIHEYDYRSQDVSTYFEEDMNRCFQKSTRPITIMFDEIEAITFGVTRGEKSADLWLDGVSFIKFWNQIKGYYSKYPKRISILVAGTNPMINDEPVIGMYKTPNPMFGQLSSSNQGAYLPAFTIEDTRNMVNTLGAYMGISFDEESVARLTSDCGGHPYLTRILCSYINKYIRAENLKRPCVISKAIYDKASSEFETTSEATSFFLMILNILMTSYVTEFNTLKFLALGQEDIISQTQAREALQHLLGYGLVDHNQGHYAIRYNVVSRYLRGEYKFERQGLNIEEQKTEIETRINEAEISLRKIVKNTLRTALGMQKATQKVLAAMHGSDAIRDSDIRKAEKLEYNQLFDTSQNKMYFSLLETIILDNIGVFSNVFDGQPESTIRKNLTIINKARRCPHHSYTEDAVNWSWDDFAEFREAITWLEIILKDFD